MSAEGYAFTIQTAIRFTTVECFKCGVLFAVDESLQKNWLRDKTSFYCPNGHAQSYTKSTAERLQEQLDAAKRDAEWQRQRAETADKRLVAAKGQMTKLQKRVNCGVCPHCQRTVSQMARHIATKHPDMLKAREAK